MDSGEKDSLLNEIKEATSINDMMKSMVKNNTSVDDLNNVVSYFQSQYNSKLADYLDSEAYNNQKKHFDELNDMFVELYNKYRHSREELMNEVEEKAHRTEYCKGGECIHRGYYSPSYSDLFIGNITRGRLLKKLPKDNKFSYVYIFDANDKLICSQKFGNSYGYVLHDITEVLIYEDDRVLSFVYEESRAGKGTLRGITECLYENGKLVRYVWAWFPAVYDGAVNEIKEETFEYTADLVSSCEWREYASGMGAIRDYRFSLNRDENDYIVSITEKDEKGKSIAVYPVQRKRK